MCVDDSVVVVTCCQKLKIVNSILVFIAADGTFHKAAMANYVGLVLRFGNLLCSAHQFERCDSGNGGRVVLE